MHDYQNNHREGFVVRNRVKLAFGGLLLVAGSAAWTAKAQYFESEPASVTSRTTLINQP